MDYSFMEDNLTFSMDGMEKDKKSLKQKKFVNLK